MLSSSFQDGIRDGSLEMIEYNMKSFLKKGIAYLSNKCS